MSCSNPRFFPNVVNLLGHPVPVPCRVCNVCRATNIQNWSSRLTYEYNVSSSCFVCFTYDDNHLRYNTGYYHPTLKRSDLHKFIDNLRHFIKNHPHFLSARDRKNFRYFAVGEYGDDKFRPHYHVLFFGLSPEFVNMFAYRCWNKGRIDVKPMLPGSIRYCLNYLEKEQKGENKLRQYFDRGFDSPFISCSPGIGSDFYFSQAKNVMKYGSMKFGQKFVSLPSYWRNKLSVFAPSVVESQKKQILTRYREMNKEARKYGFKDFNLYNEYLASIKEKEIVSKLRNSGVAVKNYSKFGHPCYKIDSNSYNKYLINQALEV